MDLLASIPDWFGTAVLGAILSVLGYLAKSAVDWRKKRKREKTALKDTLTRLSSLLHESKSLFVTQNELARRLLKSLHDNHPEEALGESGFERTFSRLYEKFSPEERDLHSIIRGITTHSLLRVNTDMSAWLKEDSLFKSGLAPVPNAKEVADYLKKLDHHLNLWHDKYKVWITNDSRHALVYLADEEQHGVGFPTGIEDVIDKALQQLK